MNSTEKKLLKKAKRRERQNQVRQALLVNEYIYTKYFDIYQEAANYYNELNNIYPTRPDLRKCDEFKAWKMSTNGAPIRISYIRKQSKVLYPNIAIQPSETSVEMPVETSVEMPVETSVEMPVETSVEMPVETSVEMPVETSVEMPVETSVEMPVETSVEMPVETSVEMPVETSVERTAKKVMELKIQLLDSSDIAETNPLNVAVEETIHEETIHPSLTEEIPPEIIAKIVKELREDPELRTIMTDIEQELEFEQIDNELDIFEDNRLEEELENLMW